MTMSRFKDTKNWTFAILAKADFVDWSPPTLCCRILMPDGTQCELRAQDAAMPWLSNLTVEHAYSTTLPRSCVKPYTDKQSAMTGIDGSTMVQLKFPLMDVQPAVAAFPYLASKTSFASADEISQMSEGAIVNMKVYVNTVGTLEEVNGLPKKQLTCTSGDYDFSIALKGDIARMPHSDGPAACLGMRLTEYRGMWTLTSTRLAAVCRIASTVVPPRSQPRV